MLVYVKIFQFQDMLNESERYCDETNGLHETIENSHWLKCIGLNDVNSGNLNNQKDPKLEAFSIGENCISP